MKDSISRTDYQGSIKFNNLLDLHNAVLIFGGEGDRSALKHNIREIGESHGGMASVLFLLASSRQNEGSFVQNVIRDIGQLNRPYRGSWDYDGPGPFHKASIDAERQKDGAFVLKIGAAYVGNQPEIKLAKQLNAPIGYHHCTIEKEYPALKDGRFRIPLEDVTRVYKAIGVDIDEESAFSALINKAVPQDSWDDRSKLPKIVLSSDDDISITIGFVSYTTVPYWDKRKNPMRDYEYRIEDGFLTGPARQGHKGEYEPVCIAVSIKPHDNPTFDHDVEKRIRQIGDVIEVTWGGNAAGSKPGFKPASMEP